MKITVSVMPKTYNFIKVWLAAAKSQDPFYKFLCFFLSFNHLYSKYRALHIDEDQDEHDMSVITRFLADTFEKMKAKGLVYKLPNELNWKSGGSGCCLTREVKILAEPELEWKSTEPYIETALANEGVVRDSDNWNVIKIFLRIYKIRCNLFHGNKSPCNKRDVQKVEESCVVLGSFLRKYLDCGLYEEENVSQYD